MSSFGIYCLLFLVWRMKDEWPIKCQRHDTLVSVEAFRFGMSTK